MVIRAKIRKILYKGMLAFGRNHWKQFSCWVMRAAIRKCTCSGSRMLVTIGSGLSYRVNIQTHKGWKFDAMCERTYTKRRLTIFSYHYAALGLICIAQLHTVKYNKSYCAPVSCADSRECRKNAAHAHRRCRLWHFTLGENSLFTSWLFLRGKCIIHETTVTYGARYHNYQIACSMFLAWRVPQARRVT